jgi:hypothetical protein
VAGFEPTEPMSRTRFSPSPRSGLTLKGLTSTPPRRVPQSDGKLNTSLLTHSLRHLHMVDTHVLWWESNPQPTAFRLTALPVKLQRTPSRFPPIAITYSRQNRQASQLLDLTPQSVLTFQWSHGECSRMIPRLAGCCQVAML